MKNELMTHSIYCPQCGSKFSWKVTCEPVSRLFVLQLRCLRCNVSDALGLTYEEYMKVCEENEIN